MNLKELDQYNLADAVKFHNRLNPKIWGKDEQLLPEVRSKLMEIAADFQEFLGVSDLDVEDVTLSGSNAAYSYTPHSDIDLHLVVNVPKDEVYQELFNAKKYQYNDIHNITIGGYDVELYVEDARKQPVSQGIYSVKNDDWVKIPLKRRASIDDEAVKSKFEDIGRIANAGAVIHSAIDCIADMHRDEQAALTNGMLALRSCSKLDDAVLSREVMQDFARLKSNPRLAEDSTDPLFAFGPLWSDEQPDWYRV